MLCNYCVSQGNNQENHAWSLEIISAHMNGNGQSLISPVSPHSWENEEFLVENVD